MAEKENGALTGNYIWGANLVLDKVAGSYYLYNAHGDVVDLTDASGTVTKRYDYDAFGNERDPDGIAPNPCFALYKTTRRRKRNE